MDLGKVVKTIKKVDKALDVAYKFRKVIMGELDLATGKTKVEAAEAKGWEKVGDVIKEGDPRGHQLMRKPIGKNPVGRDARRNG